MAIRKEAVASNFDTSGLLDQLLSVAGGVNSTLISIDDLEIGIHGAKADGEPVSSGANDAVSILDQVRPHLESALDILLDRIGSISGKSTPEPPPLEEEELEEEEFEEEVEELPVEEG